MSAPEFAIMNENGHVIYRVKFSEDDVIEQKVTEQEHVDMCKFLDIRSVQDLGQRFGDVCTYYMQKDQYVDFEEIKN